MRLFSVCLAACTLCLSLGANAAESDARYQERTDVKMGTWLKRLGRLPGQFERGHVNVTGAFREVTSATTLGNSTARILADGQQVALGVVVRADGVILTKASELSGKLECILADNTRLPAIKVADHDESDLALVRIAKDKLPVVRWSPSTDLPVGSWLISANTEPQPVAIGVVSAPPRVSPTPRAVLGVRMQGVENGVRINSVMPGTGAAKAGIRSGDVIASINGRKADSPEAITEVIKHLHPGDAIVLSVYREQSPLSLKAVLSDMSRIGGMEQAELMDSLGGPLSKRREGFPSVIQHDSIVRPRECGGPVLDLDGKVVGINIARVSRVATYALPSEVAQQAVQGMLQQINSPFPSGTTIAASPATTARPLPSPPAAPTATGSLPIAH